MLPIETPVPKEVPETDLYDVEGERGNGGFGSTTK